MSVSFVHPYTDITGFSSWSKGAARMRELQPTNAPGT